MKESLESHNSSRLGGLIKINTLPNKALMASICTTPRYTDTPTMQLAEHRIDCLEFSIGGQETV